ncbi:N-acetyltransferase family protein [Rhizobium panacihumi]|uniref:GNAT family N-acetyltransferase n=1 Tax=Rhizobium panacihumi TaxID=2008450 RepID=UPI003D79A9CC
MIIRKARKGDLGDIVNLMARHARSEPYGGTFNLDEPALVALCFGRERPAGHLLVSEGACGTIEGYALYFLQDVTFRNRPMLYLNDLMVDEACRRGGVARALMEAVCAEAWSLDCFRVKWGVASSNEAAIAFYERIGAVEEIGKRYFMIDEERQAAGFD